MKDFLNKFFHARVLQGNEFTMTDFLWGVFANITSFLDLSPQVDTAECQPGNRQAAKIASIIGKGTKFKELDVFTVITVIVCVEKTVL